MIGYFLLVIDWGVSWNSQDVVEKWDVMRVFISKKELLISFFGCS